MLKAAQIDINGGLNVSPTASRSNRCRHPQNVSLIVKLKAFFNLQKYSFTKTHINNNAAAEMTCPRGGGGP